MKTLKEIHDEKLAIALMRRGLELKRPDVITLAIMMLVPDGRLGR